jgi:hypothetical protein
VTIDKAARLSICAPELQDSDCKLDPPIGAVYCCPVNFERTPLEKGKGSRKLVAGRQPLTVKLDPGQALRFRYSGLLPGDLATPILKLNLESERMSYLIPVRFVKRLPRWAAIVMALMVGSLLLVAVWMGVVWCRLYKERWLTEQVALDDVEVNYTGTVNFE